jgi:hypothetical protein
MMAEGQTRPQKAWPFHHRESSFADSNVTVATKKIKDTQHLPNILTQTIQ